MAYAASLAGSKLRAKLGSSLNEQVSAPTSDFAQRQLKQMGWTEGTGLGKKRNGISTHISVKRREDHVGLGHSKERQEINSHQEQWWKDSMGDTLAKLSKSKSKKKKKREYKRQYTDEELFEATGGARFGMRAQRRATGKWARTESSISEADEQEAQARVEWNGQGAAATLLSKDNDDEKSRLESEQSNVSEKSVEDSEEGRLKRKRKEKKDRKRVEKETKKKKKKAKKSSENEDA